MEKNRQILPGLTTTASGNVSKDHWKRKISEIGKLKINKIALFPTVIGQKKRKILYQMLENTSLNEIPHVHLRDDMEEWELKYFVKRWNTKRFNIHPHKESFEMLEKNKRFRNMTFVENLYQVVRNELFTENSVRKSGAAGLCLDLAHLNSEEILFPESYAKRVGMIEMFRIGCNHISGSRKSPYMDKYTGFQIYDTHYVTRLSQLDYLCRFPKKYFSDIVSIELENSFKEQLKYKKYIEKIINSKKR